MRVAIEEALTNAVAAAIEAGEIHLDEVPVCTIERPRDETHGDWACSVALKSAKAAGMSPRDFASAVASHIENSDLVDSVEIAGPGFINIHLSATALQSVITTARTQGPDFGKTDAGSGKSIQVEFVSANPTGPMHVGHGRWAALGDSLARVLRHAGWSVQSEFYINDAGNQMDTFANSVSLRYLELCGQTVDFPEDGYGGAYIIDIAREILDEEGDVWASAPADEREAYFKERSYTQVLSHVKDVLHSCGVDFDVWFSERTLHAVDATGSTAVTRAIDTLDEKGYIFEKDDALWFRSTDLGDDKDRVLKKADGAYTYFASDIAYHQNKFSRGFDKVIDIWGADHHGYVARVQAAMEALGEGGKLDIVIGQLVNLLRDGKPVRLSKRTGTMVTFEELLDEVGSDATRYLMISKSSDQSIDFDIEVAKKQDSSNPVFYVQYAHARICSILRKAAEVEDADDMTALAGTLIGEDADLSVLTDASEFALMRKLSSFSEVVAGAARDYAPFRLTHYAEELAATFHQFYTRCHVLSDDPELTKARLCACDATRIVLSLVLDLLGVSAPVRM